MGRWVSEFLVGHITILGATIENWILIAASIFIAWILALIITAKRQS